MENIVDIYNLLPEKINETIRKLTNVLKIVQCRKNTNSKFVDKEKEKITCPHCQSRLYHSVRNFVSISLY